MSTHQPWPGDQSGKPYDPYGQPQQNAYEHPRDQPYGDQPGTQPYPGPYGQPEGDPYGQQYGQQYGTRQQYPYGAVPEQPGGAPHGEPYGVPRAAPSERASQRNPYAELGRLDEVFREEAQGGGPGAAGGHPATPYPAPEKPRRRRRLRGCLIIVGVLVLGVGGVIAYLGTTTLAKAGKYKLVPPDSFQGLTSDPSNPLAKSLAAGSATITKAGATPVSAAYSTHVGDRLPQVVLLGGYGTILSPGTEESALWTGFDPGALKDKTTEPSGPMGGTTQCAVVAAGGGQMPACVWADNSSVAVVMFTGQMSDTAIHPDFGALDKRLLALRAVTEVKK